MTITFEQPEVLVVSRLREQVRWQAAFNGITPMVLGYRPNDHVLVWVESGAQHWIVSAYASYEDRFHSKYQRLEPYMGSLGDVLHSVYLVGVAVQHMPNLAAFDQMCGEVLHMDAVLESSTIRLLRKS